MTPFYHNGKMVGMLNYDTGEFEKRVRQSIHLFREQNGYGISEAVLKKLPKEFIIRITNVEGWDEYTAPVERFWERGIYVDYEDPQRILPLTEFNEAKPAKTKDQEPVDSAPQESVDGVRNVGQEPRQLDLHHLWQA